MKALPYRWSDLKEEALVPLLTRRMITGEKALVAQVTLMPGCRVELHHHDSEQIAVVLSGHVRWFFEEGVPDLEMRGGEVLHLPSNVPHGIVALEETVILDILSPVGLMGVDRQSAAAQAD